MSPYSFDSILFYLIQVIVLFPNIELFLQLIILAQGFMKIDPLVDFSLFNRMHDGWEYDDFKQASKEEMMQTCINIDSVL